MPDESFQSFVREQIDRYGTARRLADAIGMSLSAFSRGVREEGTLGIESCLRLAEQTGEAPSRVLRLAGKGPVAELIERLYGPAPLLGRPNGSELELLALWNTLSRDSQVPILAIIRALVEKRPKGQRRRRI
jgi:hypothetical protein